MSTQRYPSASGGVTPSGTLVVQPNKAASTPKRGRILGTPTAVNNPFAQRNVGGVNLNGDGSLLGNPHWPCIAGPEILPLASATVPVDTGTAYYFDGHQPPTSAFTFTQVAGAQFQLAKTRQQHIVAFDLYATGNELPQDDPITVVLPLRKVTNDTTPTNATTTGGTFLNAMNSPGGNQAVLDGSLVNPSVGLFFDPTELTTNYPNARVGRIGLRWLAWRDDSATDPGPGEGFDVTWVDAGSIVPLKLYGSWAVLDYQNNAQYTTRWLGEINYSSRGRRNLAPPDPSYSLNPFTIYDLSHMAAADESVAIQILGQASWDGTQTTTFLDYIEMVVEILPERRSCVAARLVSNLLGSTYPPDFTASVALRYSLDDRFGFQLTGPDWTLVVREAQPADSSDRYRAAPASSGFLYSDMEAIGASLQLQAVSQYRGSRTLGDDEIDHRRGTISQGRLVGVPEVFEPYSLAAAIWDANYLTAGAWWASYQAETPQGFTQVYSAALSIVQWIYVDGLTTYDRVKLLAQPDDLTTADLVVTIYGTAIAVVLATVNISAAAVRALPDVGEGYREFSAAITPPITPPSGWVLVAFTSPGGASLAPWTVASAVSGGNQAFSGYDPQNMHSFAPYTYDFAVTLLCPAIIPPAPTALIQEQEILGNIGCGVTVAQIVTLTWASDPGVDRYAVDASNDGGTTWSTAAIVDNTGGTLSWTDYGPAWDVPLLYRLDSYRFADRSFATGPSTAIGPIASPGAALGISDSTVALLYVPTDESSVSMEWTDLTKSELIQLHGEDFQRALHPDEDRGLSVTFNAVMTDLLVCTAGVPESLQVGARSLSPEPYDQIRAMARAPYVLVQFPGGMVRSMHLQLGSLVVRNQFGVYLAQVILTDAKVTTLDIDPED